MPYGRWLVICWLILILGLLFAGLKLIGVLP